MNCAVRYYSRSGNTKIVAESIADALGVQALSTDDVNSAISQPVDVLFIGGALYAYGIDDHLKEYIGTLTKDNVKKAVIFSTSWISKHAIDLIRDGLEKQGIPVAADYLHFRGKPSAKNQEEAHRFAIQNAR